MKLIDTNVFIYAAGREHPYKAPCLDLLRRVERGDIEANTDIEVFQEILHFYHATSRADFGVEVMSLAATQFPHPFPVDLSAMLLAGRTLLANPQIQARDAVHSAVVLELGLDGIITADTGFDDIPGITRFDPKEF